MARGGRRAAETTTVLDDLVFPEGLRWHAGRLWLSDIHAHQVLTIDQAGGVEPAAQLTDAPSGLGFMPDGDLLVAMMRTRALLRIGASGGPAVHADLTAAPGDALNDMVVDADGRAYVGCRVDPNRFTPGGAPAAECLVVVDPDGRWEVAAEELVAPNGVAVSADGATLVIAETRAHRLTAFSVGEGGALTSRRVLADVGDAWPDGICLDAGGGVWLGAGLGCRFLRVVPGGEVTDVVEVPGRWALACVLGGEDRRTLYLATAVTTLDNLARLHGPEDDAHSDSRGRIESVRVERPGAGIP
jgi:sugar lactone lactonase YvrE